MTVNEFPYTYRAYGLNIASQMPVAGFEASPVVEPDVTIMEGRVPENLENRVNIGVLFQSNDHEFLLRFDPVAAYYVVNGNTITVQRLGNASDTDISAFLTGTCFGALLHQRKLLPLHASTVKYKNKCLMFMGISGAGKTTLATAFLNDGATLIADDISVIDLSGDTPSVTPAFPAVKIWKDSLKHLGVPDEGLEPVRGELEKYYLPVANFIKSKQPVDAVFVLGSHNKPETTLKSLGGVQKFQVIKRHTYLFRGIPKTGLEANHFRLAGELIKCVPVYQLTRSNTGFNTSGLIEVVISTIFPDA